MKPTLLVLAAGMGSRYGGLKQMDGLGPNGETIIDYSIFDAVQAGFGKVVYIVREYFREQMEQTVREKYSGVRCIDGEPLDEESAPCRIIIPKSDSAYWIRLLDKIEFELN